MIHALIVEDEPQERRYLRRLLERERDVVVSGECASGGEALSAIREKRPDLLFLDVRIPGQDGFEVLSALSPEQTPAVVFVTAYDHYAVRAFEVHAVDYLLKPYDAPRFERAFRRARQRLERRDTLAAHQQLRGLLAQLRSGSERTARFSIRTGERHIVVRAEDVDWIEAARNYVRLHVGPQSHLLRETMAEVEEALDQESFVRVHRSIIVNTERIRKLEHVTGQKWELVLADGRRLAVGANYREQIRRLLRRAK